MVDTIASSLVNGLNVKQKKYLFYSITDGSPGSAMFENKAVFLF